MLARSGRRILFILLWAGSAFGQTTQAVISGFVVDSRTGSAIPGANIRCIQISSDIIYRITTRDDGTFVLPLLPPDTYRVRVEAGEDYQAQELYNLVLPVSDNLELRFRLRPRKDVLEQYQHQSVFLPNSVVLVILGPDVDASRTGSFEANGGRIFSLESSVSNVIDPVQISGLPLQGRDVYTMISTQPGVASDNSVGRGLGISVNGQRPSSSNFMLDGLQNNNYLTTGPLAVVAPEATQEFRLSTNNFTAEYGGTTGFLANAVTRSGGAGWHGLAYLYGRRTGLNANDFQRNANAQERRPMNDLEPGFHVGGPLRRSVFYGSLAFEMLRFRSETDPQPFSVPTSLFHPQPNSIAAYVLLRYPPRPTPNATDTIATLNLAPRTSLNRYLALPRLDAVLGSKHRLFARVAVNLLNRPDLAWSPYTEFNVPLVQNTLGIGAGWTVTITPSLISEAKFGRGSERLSIRHPNGDVPYLRVAGVTLPGNRFPYDLLNRDHNWELIENLSWSLNGHAFKFGGSLLARTLDNSFSFETNGRYTFAGLAEFGRDEIHDVDFTVVRPTTSVQNLSAMENPPLPDPNHRYTYSQVALFAQDAWRLTRRLTVNYGGRYENFGTPRIVDNQVQLSLGLRPGVPLPQQLGDAHLQMKTAGLLYSSENNDWSVRLGVSYAPTQEGATLIRGAYGIFYDRPFDNYWMPLGGNTLVRANSQNVDPTNYLRPLADNVSNLHEAAPDPTNPTLTVFDPVIRNARVQSYFAGVQQEITRNLSFEMDVLGSRSSNLFTTDQINRSFSQPRSVANPFGIINPGLPPDVLYRATNGRSEYDGLAIQTNFRTARGQFHLAYTLSRSRDNQSDPLSGEFLNFAFSGTGIPGADKPLPSFTVQFDPASDWGRSDFDQRQNLVFYSLWQLPDVTRSKRWSRLITGWRISQMGAVRSGLPFSVIAVPSDGALIKNRANLIPPQNSAFEREPYPGGVKLLNAAAFATPNTGTLGNTARNEFTGPGFWSVDLSLSREFRLSGSAENLRLIFRVDAFNVFNHANLNNPDSYLSHSQQFGVALYGRTESAAGFPTLVPFDETARQLQVMLRIQF